MTRPTHERQSAAPRLAAKIVWVGTLIVLSLAVVTGQWWFLVAVAVVLLAHLVIRSLWRRS